MVFGLTALETATAIAGHARSAAAPPPLPQVKPSSETPRARPFVTFRKQRPTRIRPSSWLNQADEYATLHAIHTALSTVGDGDAYVWHRGNGLLDGLIRPTTSFKNAAGQVCRHVIIRLNSVNYSREMEGIACRDDSGGWSLTG